MSAAGTQIYFEITSTLNGASTKTIEAPSPLSCQPMEVPYSTSYLTLLKTCFYQNLLDKLENLFFVTRLEFNLFAVHNSKTDKTTIFGVSEGHWPNTTNANTFILMINHTRNCKITPCHTNNKVKVLKMHAKNYAGQNKNWFMLFYLCWRTVIGNNEEVLMDFIVAGNTRNVVDGAFGHIKRMLKSSDAWNLYKMVKIVEMISSFLQCVTRSLVN